MRRKQAGEAENTTSPALPCRRPEENREAAASINAFVDRHGLLASLLRFRAGEA